MSEEATQVKVPLAPARVAEALQFRDIVFDRAAHSVTRRSREVRLSPIEFRLLGFFIENPGRVLSRQELYDSTWGPHTVLCGRTIDVHVARLRKALTHNRGLDPIRTVRGEGYVLGDRSESVRPIPSTLERTASSLPSFTSISRGGIVNPASSGGTAADPEAPLLANAKSHRAAGFELDRTTQRVRRLGRDLRLSPRQFQLFDLLISNPGKIFSRKQIVEIFCGNSNVGLRTADAMVVRLRKAIGGRLLPDPIRTVLKVGYKFNEHFEERHAEWPALRRRKLQLPKSQQAQE